MLGNYCDDETWAILKGLPSLSPSDQLQASMYARERKEAFIHGRAMVPDFWRRALHNFDPNLQLRFDVDYQCYIVETWMKDESYWQPVLLWRDENNKPLTLGETLIPLMLSTLAKNNLQTQYRDSTEYLAKKHDDREARRKINAATRTATVLEAVDSLSSKQVSNFIDVHRAIHTGEKIVTHGADEKFLNTARANTVQVEAEGGQVAPVRRELNPGMHPLTYQRKAREQ